MFRNFSCRSAGQSLPLIALMMVVLVAFVGLSVDVGNAYGQQRRMQGAANAGALGGMNAWIASQSGSSSLTNAQVWSNVKQSLAGNRVEIDKNQYMYEAHYIEEGNPTPVFLGSWNGTSETVASGSPPAGIDRIRVRVTNRFETFFARIVHRNTLAVNGVGDACFGNYAFGIMPIGVPAQLIPYVDGVTEDKDKDKGKNNASGSLYRGSGLSAMAAKPSTAPSPSASPSPSPSPSPEPFDRVFDGWEDNNGDGKPSPGDTLGNPIDPDSADWSDWGKDGGMINKVIYMPIENKHAGPGLPGNHIGWMDWTGGGGGSTELGKALTLPGTLHKGYVNAKDSNDKTLDIGDWFDGHPGVKGSEADELQALLGKEILLPFYSEGEDNGTKSKYKFSDLGKFIIIGYELNGSPKGGDGVNPPDDDDNKYLIIEYKGPATPGTATGCASVTG